MKKTNALICVLILFISVITSCVKSDPGRQYLAQIEKEMKEEQKMHEEKSLWNDSTKAIFLNKYGKNDFDLFIYKSLIYDYELKLTDKQLESALDTFNISKYKSQKSRYYRFNIDLIAGRTPEYVNNIFGKPDSKEIVHPSRVNGKCVKQSYLNGLLEIVFIDNKADWITIFNAGSFAYCANVNAFRFYKVFDSYIYIKAYTD